MMLPLEDNFTDVIGKAQRGLGVSDSAMAAKTGVDQARIRQVREGEVDEDVIRAIAPVLNLNADTLFDLAAGKWKPAEIGSIDGLAVFTTNYGEMTVNSYLIWDPSTSDAVAFDSGADCAEMLRTVARRKLRLKLILLTHSHPDHVAELPRLREETGAHVYISAREAIPGAESIEEGKRFKAGNIDIDSRLTRGHSEGGITYVVSGLTKLIAIAGDSIFAGSMGGGSVSYSDALKNNLEKILTLPDETVICPGHGPMTTVGEEKKHNPFFAGKIT